MAKYTGTSALGTSIYNELNSIDLEAYDLQDNYDIDGALLKEHTWVAVGVGIDGTGGIPSSEEISQIIIQGTNEGGGTTDVSGFTPILISSVKFNSIRLQWTRLINLTNHSHFRVRVSSDNATWYELKFDGTSPGEWKTGSSGNYLDNFNDMSLLHQVPLDTGIVESILDQPIPTTLYYQVSEVAKLYEVIDTYDDTETYGLGDKVYYNGLYYESIDSANANNPPDSSSDYWDIYTAYSYVQSNWSSTATVIANPIDATVLATKIIDTTKIDDEAVDALQIAKYAVSTEKMNPNVLKVPSTGLIGYWAFDEIKEYTGSVFKCTDSSGEGHDAIIHITESSVVTGEGISGNAVGMNTGARTLEYISIDGVILDTFDGSLAYSISGWIKTTDESFALFAQYGTGTESYEFYFGLKNGYATWNKNGVDIASSTSLAGVTDGQWHFMGASRSTSGAIKIYIDGYEVTLNGTANDPNPFPNIDCQIASYDATHGLMTDGYVDEVRVYNRELGLNEWLSLYTLPMASGSISQIIETKESITAIVGDNDLELGTTNLSQLQITADGISATVYEGGPGGTSLLSNITQNAEDITLRAEAWETLEEGNVLALSGSTITLSASGNSDTVEAGDEILVYTSAGGFRESQTVSSYASATNIATVDTAWGISYQAGDTYESLRASPNAKIKVSSEDGGYILLDAAKVIVPGTIEANLIDADSITAREMNAVSLSTLLLKAESLLVGYSGDIDDPLDGDVGIYVDEDEIQFQETTDGERSSANRIKIGGVDSSDVFISGVSCRQVVNPLADEINQEFLPGSTFRVFSFEADYEDQFGNAPSSTNNPSRTTSWSRFGSYSFSASAGGTSTLQYDDLVDPTKNMGFCGWLGFFNASSLGMTTLFASYYYVGFDNFQVNLTYKNGSAGWGFYAKFYEWVSSAVVQEVEVYYLVSSAALVAEDWFVGVVVNYDEEKMSLVVNNNISTVSISSLTITGTATNNHFDIRAYNSGTYLVCLDDVSFAVDDTANPDIFAQHYNHNVPWNPDYSAKDLILRPATGGSVVIDGGIKHSGGLVCFAAALETAISPASGADQTIKFDNITVNEGECYSSSTGQFTAPYHGVYHFFANLNTSNNSSRTYAIWWRNGAALTAADFIDGTFGTTNFGMYASAGDVYSQGVGDIYITLDADDTIELRVPDPDGGVMNKYSSFSGQLVTPTVGATGATGATGADGADGAAMEYLGSYASEPSGSSLNVYYNSSNYTTYIHNGSAWEVMIPPVTSVYQ